MKFRLFHIPVIVQPTFWPFLFFFCYSAHAEPMFMLLLAFVLILSLWFHEYGHAVAAVKYGKHPTITLEAFGGYVSYTSGGLDEKQQCLIVTAGPCFTALLMGASYYLLKSHLFASYWANCFCYCATKLNTYWLIVNLAPIFPLDGGQIARYLLRRYVGDEKGTILSLFLGMGAACIGAIYFLFHQELFFACLFLFYGAKAVQDCWAYPVRWRKASGLSLLSDALDLLANEKFSKAQKLFQRLIRSKDASIRTRALQGLAQALERQEKYADAYQLLITHDVSKIAEGKWLLCKLAYGQKNFRLVAQNAHEIYAMRPTFETALLNARAHAHLGEAALAEGWLHTALQFEEAKAVSREDILSDSAFAELRK